MNRIFASCDIVCHSQEKDIAVQMQRVAAINAIVRESLQATPDEVIWASGGDGGHVAFPDQLAEMALDLIIAWRKWSVDNSVSLRIVANCGKVQRTEGADGRTQLVGDGINFSGRLLRFGSQDRVVVSDSFREAVLKINSNRVRFHAERSIEPQLFPNQFVWLLSTLEHQSRWDGTETADRGKLNSAVNLKEGLEVIYRAKRLLETNANDQSARNALRQLSSDRLLKQSDLISKLLLDVEFGEEAIRAMHLIERRHGETLFEAGEEGQTMFLLLRGRVAGFFPSEKDICATASDFVMKPGELVGELAFALQRRRTATLICLDDCAFISFNYAELEGSVRNSNRRNEILEFVQRQVRQRISEHIWNSAAFLPSSQNDLRPETTVYEKGWVDLVPFISLLELDSASTKKIQADDQDFKTKGLYILVSGRLESPDHKDLDGEKEPVLFAHLPGEIEANPRTYYLLEDTKIVLIEADGLHKLGVTTFRYIVNKLKDYLGKLDQGQSQTSFDVFLCHNSRDKPKVKQLGAALRERGVMVWLDEWELQPGTAWVDALENIISTCKSAAVCVGENGIGPWEIPEMQALLQRFVDEKRSGNIVPIIPVLLPGAPTDIKLPVFLTTLTWVDLRGGLNSDNLDRLQWGMTGVKPGS